MFKKKTAAQDGILELYDGQIARLSGKTLIADNIPKLRYSSKGKELFALSECLYAQWLKEGDFAHLKRALSMCREAVAEGYPHAVVKMGFYYDKDYLSTDRTEEFRCRVACDYYGKVVYCDAVPENADGVIPEISWEELQKSAAMMLLDMLAAAKKGLAVADSARYSFDENFRRIKERINIPAQEYDFQTREERDREKFAQTVFESCKHNRTRAPLFGVMALSCGEARRVFAPKSAALKLCGDINIWLCDGAKIFKANNTAKFADFTGGLNCETVWVYFFNNNQGGHRFFKSKQRKDMCDLMMEDNFSRFSTLQLSASERGKSEYLFSDDDVQFFMKTRFTPLKSALDGLIDSVINDRRFGD